MTTFEQAFEDFSSRYLPFDAEGEFRRRLACLARVEDVARDQTLLVDEHIEQFVYICTGSTKLVAHASHSRDQIVAFHFAGDVVSIPARMHHSYSICALRDATLLSFPGERFLDIARENAVVIGRLFAASSTSLLRCREKTVTLGRKSASERIATFLLAMAERIGTPVDRGISLDLPMSRRDIADSLGLTIETVSRQLTLLREQSLIETVGRSGILLLDPNRLEDCAGYLSAAA